MNLYQKGLLAFAVVILIAVATVALLVGQRAETEFRTYNALYSNRAQMMAETLTAYFAEHNSWHGVESALATLSESTGWRGGRGSAGGGNNAGGGQAASWDYKVSDADGNVVADSMAPATGKLSQSDLQQSLPIFLGDDIVGYLLPVGELTRSAALDAPAQQFLDQLWSALLWGGSVAFVAALLLAGVLTRGIVAPVRQLTRAAEAIAAGDLDVRAAVRGNDEIAHLADTFNGMATNLKRAEDARRAQTADIAHELRNPLAVLQGTLEALADGIYEPTPDNTQPALDQVHTLNRLVGDLRTLALADAGQLHLERQPVDVNVLLERALDAYRESLAEKDIALEYTAVQVLPINADYDRLTQVVGNLLSNAARYVTSGGIVRVSAQFTGDGIEVRIADNGPGVPEADRARLFERFWRGDPSRSRATGGSGLGLAIARHVIEAHGGRIWAEATPGGGLTVIFWVPTI